MQVEYIDHMGDDLRVVNAARVSFNKESFWIDNYGVESITKEGDPKPHTLQEKDQKLLKYLANHDHWTPFSHVIVTMRETVPIFVARQRFKHMVGFTYNEVSRRYVDDEPEFYFPDKWRKRADNKKQGSSEEEVKEIFIPDYAEGYKSEPGFAYSAFLDYARFLYEGMVKSGVAPEQARMVLPQSMYTSYYTTGSLPAWARAYKLRVDTNAQKEIQELAAQWNKVISSIPELKYSWNALIE
ncbi:FAD-dependent thymidylate synthase [Acinetobacter sp.]|uniref:FAD-dependent thymidylate synthase n=1 Tax=Acinetobacter sp. TaxID=472 RepID=UPI0025B93F39|nr:FAD-dependent thymidylate synthase [Acinetobacter sp.]